MSNIVKMYGDLMIFSGTANHPLAEAVAAHLKVDLGRADIRHFDNSDTFVKLGQSVRAKDVFVIQPTAAPVNDNLMELLIFIDTLKRDSAGRITAVIPYYGYGRTDKKDQPRVPITARLVADLLAVAGADRVLTLDLHAKQIQGFFSIACDELPALDLFVDYFNAHPVPNVAIVAPDIGSVRRARNFADKLGLPQENGDKVLPPLAVVEKQRSLDGKYTVEFNLIGDVAGRNVIIVDDEIDTAGTLVKAANYVRERGALDVYACATHAILSVDAPERIRDSALASVIVTDTALVSESKRQRSGDKLHIIPIAPLLADVILRIHEGRSVGELFRE